MLSMMVTVLLFPPPVDHKIRLAEKQIAVMVGYTLKTGKQFPGFPRDPWGTPYKYLVRPPLPVPPPPGPVTAANFALWLQYNAALQYYNSFGGNSFLYISAGPDQTFGTADDIRGGA